MIRVGFSLLAVCLFLMAMGGDDIADKLLEQYKKDSASIMAKLSAPDTWKHAYYQNDKAKTEILLKYLELNSNLRCEKVEEILIKHITYSPFEGQIIGLMLPEDQYPVYGTLCKIGIRSVNSLVKLLKTANPDNPRDRSSVLAIYCLIDIYDQGGQGEKMGNGRYAFKPEGIGKKMTKQRLLLELEGATGKEKEYLEKALKHPALNIDKKDEQK